MHAFGKRLGKILEPGDVIALAGPLGAGKTTLARGILAGAGYAGEVPSPTFAIVQPYEPPALSLPVWHVDLYRLEGPDEVRELGLWEIADEGALLIEWPDRMGGSLPPGSLHLLLAGAGDAARILTWTAPPSWEKRWPA